MARKNCTPEEKERRSKIRELLQASNTGSMDDIQELFKETMHSFLGDAPDLSQENANLAGQLLPQLAPAECRKIS